MIQNKPLGITSVKDTKLKIEYVSIHSLQPNSYNPNKHDVRSFNLLIKSIAMFGFTQPIVVRKETNEIIDGEHRWRVAAILDIVEVPVTFISLSDNEMQIATIIHNKARGVEDPAMIKRIDEYFKKYNIDLSSVMLSKQ